MGTVKLYANKGAVIHSGFPGSNFATRTVEDLEGSNSVWQLYGFQSIPDSLLFKPILSVQPWMFVYGQLTSANAWCVALGEDFDRATVTWNTMPAQSEYFVQSHLQYYDAVLNQYCPFFQLGDQVARFDAIRYGLRFSGYGALEFDSDKGTSKPYLEVNYGDTDVTPGASGSPQSGYVDKNKAKTFYWYLSGDDTCIGSFTQTSATFRWRVGSDGEIHTVSAGTTGSVTIPAGTFPTGTIQWQVTVSVNSGASVTTPWYSVSTVEALSSAQAVSPVNTIVDGRGPVTFRWNHIISTGTLPTKSELQVFSNDEWSDLATVTGGDTSTIVNGNDLPGGQIFWRVRTYNTDNAAGSWSEAANIIVVSAPPAPVVSATQSPRPVISWQSEGQQAYEVELNGKTVNDYGAEKTVRWMEYLPDGTYLANVRVQNSFGLWSDPGTVQIDVQNTSGEDIELSVFAEYEARLQWVTEGEYESFIVYRDGVAIGKTNVPYYTDRFSVGSVQYYVLGVLSDSDNYTKSNTQTVEVSSDTTRIFNIATEEWISLPLTDEQYRTWNLELTATASYFHTSGANYPSVEVSRFRDKVVRFSVSVLTKEECDSIEACIGKMICIKHKGTEMTVGVPMNVNKTVENFYTSYFITLQQVQLEEGVDL